jgi:hypothetical protein
VQIARRVEEVRAQEMLPELGRESLGNARQRNTAGVGGEDGAGLAMSQHLLDEGALDLKSFRDGFDDPIAVSYFGQVVFEIAGCDE